MQQSVEQIAYDKLAGIDPTASVVVIDNKTGEVRALVGTARGEHRVEDRCLLGVTRDPDIGHGHEAEPRVLDPSLEHLRDDDLDPVGDLANPWACHGCSLLPGVSLPR